MRTRREVLGDPEARGLGEACRCGQNFSATLKLADAKKLADEQFLAIRMDTDAEKFLTIMKFADAENFLTTVKFAPAEKLADGEKFSAILKFAGSQNFSAILKFTLAEKLLAILKHNEKQFRTHIHVRVVSLTDIILGHNQD